MQFNVINDCEKLKIITIIYKYYLVQFTAYSCWKLSRNLNKMELQVDKGDVQNI